MRYNIYPAEKFGISGVPDTDESYAVLIRLNDSGIETGEALAVYIVNDDPYMPPNADMATASPVDIQNRPDGVLPTFHNVDIDDDGRMVLPVHGKTWELNREQKELMVNPQTLHTDRGEFWLSGRGGNIMAKDESFISIPAIRMDQNEFYRVLNEKYPALLERTHTRYGERFPILPGAKYFEEQDKTVVFIAASQLKYVSEKVLDGDEVFYRDRSNGDEWDLHNTYGVCIIDDLHDPGHYEAKLISPYQLDLYIEQMGRENGLEKEDTREKNIRRDDGFEPSR